MLSVTAAILVWHCLAFPVQDPFVVAPQAYKRQFENDWVRVVRVRYGARETIPAHDHPKGPTIYVYLTSSGPVRFKHTSKPVFVVDRPPVKPGGFRLGYPANETHEVESRSDQVSEFLRVELKTEVRGVESFRGRFPPKNHSANRNSQKTRFKNGQVSIISRTCAPRGECKVETNKDRPRLLIAINSIRFKREQSSELQLDSGQTLWIETGSTVRLENISNETAELLEIEFKTSPAGFVR